MRVVLELEVRGKARRPPPLINFFDWFLLGRGVMNLRQAFPIAIIDEDYAGVSVAGRGMRQLAAEIEKSGFRTVRELGYDDAHRLSAIFNSESCWLISVDGTEESP